MEERWVCKRCFASVDDRVGACPTCGLLRGSEVPVGDQWSQPAAAGQGPARRPAWRVLAQFWWIPVAVAVAGSAWFFGAHRDESGAIHDAGDLHATELRMGDCFDLKEPDEQLVEQVKALPCSEPHQYELFFAGEITGDEYPGQDAFDQFAFERCLPAFETYVGAALLSTRLDMIWLTPTQDSWSSGDQTVQCAVYDPARSTITGSLRDTES